MSTALFNAEKLKDLEQRFLSSFPGGFQNPQMDQIRKKHKMDQMVAMTQGAFPKNSASRPDQMVNDMVKILTRSSMVSVFEKPKFRDFAKALSIHEKELLADGLESFFHGDQRTGFQKMLDILQLGQMMRWSVISCWGAYFKPQEEVFCKPTTVKKIVSYLEMDGLVYQSKPDFDFYAEYRHRINEMKQKVDPSLAINNAAFSGFLMMMI